MEKEEAADPGGAELLARVVMVMVAYIAGLSAAVWGYIEVGIGCLTLGTVMAILTLLRLYLVRRRSGRA